MENQRLFWCFGNETIKKRRRICGRKNSEAIFVFLVTPILKLFSDIFSEWANIKAKGSVMQKTPSQERWKPVLKPVLLRGESCLGTVRFTTRTQLPRGKNVEQRSMFQKRGTLLSLSMGSSLGQVSVCARELHWAYVMHKFASFFI